MKTDVTIHLASEADLDALVRLAVAFRDHVGERTPSAEEFCASLAVGRVPDACGYSFEPSPKPPASSDSTGHEPSKSVFNPSLAPLGLHLSTPSLSTS